MFSPFCVEQSKGQPLRGTHSPQWGGSVWVCGCPASSRGPSVSGCWAAHGSPSSRAAIVRPAPARCPVPPSGAAALTGPRAVTGHTRPTVGETGRAGGRLRPQLHRLTAATAKKPPTLTAGQRVRFNRVGAAFALLLCAFFATLGHARHFPPFRSRRRRRLPLWLPLRRGPVRPRRRHRWRAGGHGLRSWRGLCRRFCRCCCWASGCYSPRRQSATPRPCHPYPARHHRRRRCRRVPARHWRHWPRFRAGASAGAGASGSGLRGWPGCARWPRLAARRRCWRFRLAALARAHRARHALTFLGSLVNLNKAKSPRLHGAGACFSVRKLLHL